MMIFKSFLTLILIFNFSLLSSDQVLAQEEEVITEDTSEDVDEDSEGAIENHLAIRKKKNIKKSKNTESTAPKHVHTTKGDDDDVVLELDRE